MKTKRTLHQQQYQQGAALLAVLVVALVLVILMSVASQTMQSRLNLAENSKQQLFELANAHAKLSELVYLLATQRITVAGVSQGLANPKQVESGNNNSQWVLSVIGDEIRLDGKDYIAESGVKYSLQNEAGLIPINSRDQYWLTRWLKGYGYSHFEQSKYTDILADYLDPDDWRRPRGAEKSLYNSQKMKYPANFLMQTCSELRLLLHWHEVLGDYPSILEQCSLSRAGGINVNVIPTELWAVLWPNSMRKLEQQRANNLWFTNSAKVLAIESDFLLVQEDFWTILGGNTFIVKANTNKTSLSLRLTRGQGRQQPYTLRLSL